MLTSLVFFTVFHVFHVLHSSGVVVRPTAPVHFSSNSRSLTSHCVWHLTSPDFVFTYCGNRYSGVQYGASGSRTFLRTGLTSGHKSVPHSVWHYLTGRCPSTSNDWSGGRSTSPLWRAAVSRKRLAYYNNLMTLQTPNSRNKHIFSFIYFCDRTYFFSGTFYKGHKGNFRCNS